jgi:tetratricopeptide (TPR) repeat protein
MAAINIALELDSNSAEIHYTMALINAFGMWDWKAGEEAFKKAIEINPNHAEAHGLYSHLLNIMGRPSEAMGHIELALKLDPFNPIIKIWYSQDLLFVHRYDDVISVSREVFEMNPSVGGALEALVFALHLTGRYDEALEELKLAFNILYKDFDHAFDQGYAKAGYAGALELEADTLVAQSKTKYVSWTSIAGLYIMAGNKEQALECLEKAYEVHAANLPYIGRPIYDSLRDDQRFQELLRKMNLPTTG